MIDSDRAAGCWPWGLVLPILGGVIGLTVKRVAGLGTGDLAALAFLAGSAS